MPVLKKNTRIDSFKKDSKVGSGRARGLGTEPYKSALEEAIHAFKEEFGRSPDWEYTRVVGFSTTFDTHVEVIELDDKDKLI